MRSDRRTPIERDARRHAGARRCTRWRSAIGFARVFSGWDFLPDLALLVIVGHGVSFALRRARVSGWIAIPAMAVVLAVGARALPVPRPRMTVARARAGDVAPGARSTSTSSATSSRPPWRR